MIVGMATFEHLPVRVGGLAEAVTSLARSLSREEEVMVFMPSHGLIHGESDMEFKKYGDYEIIIGEDIHPVTVFETEREGVRLFLFSNQILDSPQVYGPRKAFIKKMVHFTKALPGFINLLLKKEGKKPEVIHINDWHCVLAGALVKKYFKIPFIFTIHRLCRERMSVKELNEVNLGELVDPRYLEGDFFNIESFGAHYCDYLTTVSYTYLNEEWKTFFGTFDGKTTYVWNGMDYDFWDPQKLKEPELTRRERRAKLLKEHGLEEGILFFNVGRLDAQQKGIDVLLHSLDLLMREKVKKAGRIKDQFRFILLGSGDKTLEEKAVELEKSYQKNVRVLIDYLGREITREYYGAADFCLIPSNFEPFGLVQLEAMCMGCIPVGTRVGGINDTVLSLEEFGEEATGKLVPPQNPKALAEAMVEMALLQQEREEIVEKIRRKGRAHVMENFSWDRAAERYKQVYQNKATVKLPFVSYAEAY
ncbi:MAG: glycogen synthase [Candidatus Syntrophonatronum acetioxidans]|uniref:starch synthase n=1 Tax=Candidatus Syntrophonatronum acetioxidans TaxID=1795816 RepID=A0A424Y926_9FIRM|nr:MAG: glycogen synthase [Candidatus Syntrophonatronum acetioxidans]